MDVVKVEAMVKGVVVSDVLDLQDLSGFGVMDLDHRIDSPSTKIGSDIT